MGIIPHLRTMLPITLGAKARRAAEKTIAPKPRVLALLQSVPPPMPSVSALKQSE
jgi:hypothetical protein